MKDNEIKAYIEKVREETSLLKPQVGKLSKKPKNLVAEFCIPIEGLAPRIEVLEV